MSMIPRNYFMFLGGVVLIAAVGVLSWKYYTRPIGCGMDPQLVRLHIMDVAIQSYVADRLAVNPDDASPSPRELHDLVPDYLSERDFQKLNTPPITYTCPESIPPKGTVYLTRVVERGKIIAEWDGEAKIILNQR